MNTTNENTQRALTSAEKTLIRKHLGHGDGNRRVRVVANGEVHCYGSTDPYDRQHDYWYYAGEAEELLREAKAAVI